MKWEHPPIIKIYEALGAVADNRVELSENTAKVFSSSGNKFYDVSYDRDSNSIMTNDNGSYWKGYLGYPAIAYLFINGVLDYNQAIGDLMKGIKWKDINQEFKNDFEKTLEYILEPLNSNDRKNLITYVNYIDKKIAELDLSLLGTKKLPPKGY
jgi:hypothetical protein